MKKLILLSLCFHLMACLPVTKPDDQGAQVRVVFVRQIVDEALVEKLQGKCTEIGEVVGTEGHWYDYLFIANDDMVNGALSDMRNRAAEMGANTVLLYQNLPFSTSVTFLGEAYHCSDVI